MGKPPEHLGELLTWPYWEVQRKSARILRKIRRGIPDDVIAVLLAKWRVCEPRSVWEAVDDALGEILATDTIEDD